MVRIFDDIQACSTADVARLQQKVAIYSPARCEKASRYKDLYAQWTCLKAFELIIDFLEPQGIQPPLDIVLNDYGKPFLAQNGTPLDYHISISHCKKGVAVAFDKSPVGVDMESFRNIRESLIAKTMNAHEQHAIRNAKEPTMEFLKFWTRKEAYLKLLGTGIQSLEKLPEILADFEPQNTPETYQNSQQIQIQTFAFPQKEYVYSIAKKSAI